MSELHASFIQLLSFDRRQVNKAQTNASTHIGRKIKYYKLAENKQPFSSSTECMNGICSNGTFARRYKYEYRNAERVWKWIITLPSGSSIHQPMFSFSSRQSREREGENEIFMTVSDSVRPLFGFSLCFIQYRSMALRNKVHYKKLFRTAKAKKKSSNQFFKKYYDYADLMLFSTCATESDQVGSIDFPFAPNRDKLFAWNTFLLCWNRKVGTAAAVRALSASVRLLIEYTSKQASDDAETFVNNVYSPNPY